MIKMVDLLVRKDGWTHQEFVDYWLDEHAPIAKELPGLKKYSTSIPTDVEKAGFDGIVELYFEDVAALGAAFESEEGQAMQADAAEFIDLEAGPRLIVDETVQVDEL